MVPCVFLILIVLAKETAQLVPILYAVPNVELHVVQMMNVSDKIQDVDYAKIQSVNHLINVV